MRLRCPSRGISDDQRGIRFSARHVEVGKRCRISSEHCCPADCANEVAPFHSTLSTSISQSLSELIQVFKDVGSNQDDSVFSIISMPVNSSPRFCRNITSLESLRRAIVTNDCVSPLEEVHNGG